MIEDRAKEARSTSTSGAVMERNEKTRPVATPASASSGQFGAFWVRNYGQKLGKSGRPGLGAPNNCRSLQKQCLNMAVSDLLEREIWFSWSLKS
jgi:hypothetical protein